MGKKWGGDLEEGQRSEDLDKKTCGVWSRDSFYSLGLAWPQRTVWTCSLSPKSKEKSLGLRSSLPVAMPSTFIYRGRPQSWASRFSGTFPWKEGGELEK